MFWSFKKKSKADAVLEIMDEAISFAATKWSYFATAVPFKAEVGLRDRIGAFLRPATEGLKNKYPQLRSAPDTIFLIIVAKGVERSGTLAYRNRRCARCATI